MKKITIFIVCIVTSLNATAAGQITSSPVSYSANLMQMLLGLFVILAMIIGLVWLLKKMGYKGYAGSEVIKVKSCLPLSTKEKLMLVEVGEEQLLIGVAPGFIGHIKTLETTIDEINKKNEAPVSSLFSDKLKAMLNNDEAIK